MAIIAEYEASSPFAHEALEKAPDMTLLQEDLYFTPDGDELWFVFWASGDDFTAFEEGLEVDPTVKCFDILTDLRDRRLYTTTITKAPEETVYSTMVEQGIQILRVEHDLSKTLVRIRCPSRDAFVVLKRAWEAEYGEFVTHSIYLETEGGSVGAKLTPKQRETLCLALERGYFNVPRQVGIHEVGRELCISDSAASQRVRRGIQELVREECRPEKGRQEDVVEAKVPARGIALPTVWNGSPGNGKSDSYT